MPLSFYFYANPFQQESVSAALQVGALLHGKARLLAPEWLISKGLDAQETPEENMQGDALLSFGGDGTLLRASSPAARRGIPVLGIHTGHVGFLMRSRADDERLPDKLLSGEYNIECRPMLKVERNAEATSYLALNDVSVTRGEHPGVMGVRVEADGKWVYTPHGDGVVVSTPTGATAYAMAAGGPIVHPGAGALLITPLCAREMLCRAAVLPENARIALRIPFLPRDRAQLAIDGQTLISLHGGDEVRITTANEKLKLISFENEDFFDTLRRKMALWNDINS